MKRAVAAVFALVLLPGGAPLPFARNAGTARRILEGGSIARAGAVIA